MGIPVVGTKMLEVIANAKTRTDSCAAVCELPMIRVRYMPSQVTANWKATSRATDLRAVARPFPDLPADGETAQRDQQQAGRAVKGLGSCLSERDGDPGDGHRTEAVDDPATSVARHHLAR
jgi:hypothetical protein